MDQKGSREICEEILEVIWMRKDASVNWTGDGGTGENWTDSAYVLRALPIGLAGRLGIEV